MNNQNSTGYIQGDGVNSMGNTDNRLPLTRKVEMLDKSPHEKEEQNESGQLKGGRWMI